MKDRLLTQRSAVLCTRNTSRLIPALKISSSCRRLEDAVRMITLAPEISGGVELVRELKARGWVISIGHTRADLEVLDEACDAGARHMTHFMNAMPPLHHRAPGPMAWGLSREDVTFDVIADGIHLDPFMLRLLVKIKGVRGITLISDAIAAAGKGDGDYQIWGETIAVKNGRTAQRVRQHCRFSDQHARRSAADAFTRRFVRGSCADGFVKSRASCWVSMMNVVRSKSASARTWSLWIQNGNVKLTFIGGRPVS